MLAIRMQRTGRKGHAQFRVIVQDSRFSPSSGRVVAYLGSYDPHSKKTQLDKQKIANYLSNGAQPSDRVIKLLKEQSVALPEWVAEASPSSRSIRNPEKLRRNRPIAPKTPEPGPAEEPAAEPTASAEPAESAPDGQAEDEPTETTPEQPAPEAKQEPAAQTPEPEAGPEATEQPIEPQEPTTKT